MEKTNNFEMNMEDTALVCTFLLKVLDEKFEDFSREPFVKERPALKDFHFNIKFSSDARKRAEEIVSRMCSFVVQEKGP